MTDEICAPPKKGGEKTLDVLMIPGPDPWAYEPTEAINRFIRGHFESGTDVLTVCTGVYVAGPTGILKGKRATGPRELVPELKRKFPEALWEDKRWVSDGNLWNSGMLPSLSAISGSVIWMQVGLTLRKVVSLMDRIWLLRTFVTSGRGLRLRLCWLWLRLGIGGKSMEVAKRVRVHGGCGRL